ncbi:SAV_915 family protein [Amycolatopsis aidingensis]|uniref:SAV_915 family protein n=1 Tax=Amycolatopsis aidingensis TaxID=2842453 RepID=UPI001C0C7892|nr:SAV_915 family protein [Amycolatopsis aidingensis]
MTEGDIPELVYLPTQRVRHGEPAANLELRRTEDGRTALLGYTSMELLVQGCGPDQPWIAVPAHKLERLYDAGAFDLLALNVELTEDMRHG